MSTNRFNKPVNQPIMNTYAPLPFQELLMAGQAKQAQQDQAQSGVIDLGTKQFNYLSKDAEKAREARNWLEKNTGKLSDMDLTTKEGKREMQMFLKEGKKRFGQDGDIGAMQSNFNAYKTWSENARKRIGKSPAQGGITQEQFKIMSDNFLNNYQGIGPKTLDGYNTLYTEDVASNVNFADWADEHGKGFETRLNEVASSKTGGRYIQEGKTADEVLTKKEIKDVLLDYAKSDSNLQNYLKQGSKYGYANAQQLVDAITGASKKYEVEKHTETRHSKVDSYGLDAVKRQRDFEDKMKNEPVYYGQMSLQDSEAKNWNIFNFDSSVQNITEKFNLGISKSRQKIEGYENELNTIKNNFNTKGGNPEEYARAVRDINTLIAQEKGKIENFQNEALSFNNERVLANEQAYKELGYSQSKFDTIKNNVAEYERLSNKEGSQYLKNKGIDGISMIMEQKNMNFKSAKDLYYSYSKEDKNVWDKKANEKYAQLEKDFNTYNEIKSKSKNYFIDNRNNKSTAYTFTPLNKDSKSIRPGAMQVENHIRTSTNAALNGTYKFTDINGKSIDVTKDNYDFNNAEIIKETGIEGGGYSIKVPVKSFMYDPKKPEEYTELYVSGTGVTNLEEVIANDNLNIWKRTGYDMSSPIATRAIRSSIPEDAKKIQAVTTKLIPTVINNGDGTTEVNASVVTSVGNYKISPGQIPNTYYITDPLGKTLDKPVSSYQIEDILLRHIYSQK